MLANWIAELGRASGYSAQATSVPGVAQRTGSTVYYIELAKKNADAPPVMAQMPMPGDVDIVIASELVETGRAVLRGFSSADRTVLIGSTHRIYAMSEKMVRGDGSISAERILVAAAEKSQKFIGFDMEAAAERSGSVISSIMFGALAGSGALPFERSLFEDTITASGIAVESNLNGFEEGFAAARRGGDLATDESAIELPVPTTEAGQRLAERIAALPDPARPFALTGVQRMMDYQDEKYATLYLERLEILAEIDREPFDLTREAARHLALWMAYEDTIRVADLKIRDSRFARVRDEVQAKEDQIVHIEEFMHPRLQEVAETLSPRLGRWLQESRLSKQVFGPLFENGRHVRTSGSAGFALLFFLSRMRRFRRHTLRYREEQTRIESWLSAATAAAYDADHDLALEIVRCQRLIKGYGDTFERSLKEFRSVMAALDNGKAADAETVRERREAALAKVS